jgi:predicted dehydrogenase
MGVASPGTVRGSTLRVGIIGAGFIGDVHARAATRAGARVVGIVASTPEGTERAVRRVRAEVTFRAAAEMIASPDIDVVHVCTPNDLHRSLTEAALAAGKHVVCEKPLAMRLDDARALCDAVDAAGLVATVPFAYRFYPMVREARARVAGPDATVRLVHGSYLQDWLSTEQDDNWRVDGGRGGPSRAFADIGSHWCDLVEFVTGDRITSLCAELVTALPERVSGNGTHAFETRSNDQGRRRPVDTEDVAIVMFRTARGVTGSVVISQISSGHKNQLRFEIACADATIVFDQEQPDLLWVGRRGPSELYTRDPAYLHPSAAAYVTVPAGHPQGYQDCFDAFVADTYRAIHLGSADAVDGLPTFADGVRAVLITDAVLRSAAAHEWVDVTVDATPPVRSTNERRGLVS